MSLLLRADFSFDRVFFPGNFSELIKLSLTTASFLVRERSPADEGQLSGFYAQYDVGQIGLYVTIGVPLFHVVAPPQTLKKPVFMTLFGNHSFVIRFFP